MATDASAAQLAQAPRHPGVTYRAGLAQESGLPDASVDLVTVAQALHWLDLPGSTRRCAGCSCRTASSRSGAMASSGWTTRRWTGCWLQFYGAVVGPYWAPERRLVETGYRTRAVSLRGARRRPRSTWPSSGQLPELLAYLRTWSATSAFVKARGFDPVTALAAELGAAWGPADRAPAGPLAPQPPHRQAAPARANFRSRSRPPSHGARRCRP